MSYRLKFILFSPFAILFTVAAACSDTTPARLHPADLLAAPQKYLNREVEVEIVEPLSGPATQERLAKVQYGQVRIVLPDAVGAELYLVPPEFRPEDPNRYKNKFKEVLAPPLMVKGTFISDPDLAKDLHRPVYLIRVRSSAPAPVPTPARVTLSEIQSHPKQWDRRLVEYEGIYTTGFEKAALDDKIWLSFQANTQFENAPTEKNRGHTVSYKVKVTGRLYSKPGARYGHLGGYPYELYATRVEFLGAAPTTKP